MKSSENVVKGRFAPSPTGRMHLGNIFTALISWLSAKSAGGRWVLRIEDLDPQRSRMEYARQIEDDLLWLGLEWDEGGIADGYLQSRRHGLYEKALARLEATGLTYSCYCTKADILATQAPHASDGRVIYPGTCRGRKAESDDAPHSVRLMVPDSEIAFTDAVFGSRSINLARECGDFVLRRADGAWAYQLAVVVDDADMGITQVVRGCDLLDSCAQQIYLCSLLGYESPRYVHLPLVCNSVGVRLGKRDASLSMDTLRRDFTPQQLIGRLAAMAGIIETERPVTPQQLAEEFAIGRIAKTERIIC
ncbi:MAG: tRNA glutamyl-Q(34) synthetase GluQRS [Paramuribaculum sp.]|nr:tRNA glutamyl-Q(34) synthetase GluQRS [Paramuribaculum sp.]